MERGLEKLTLLWGKGVERERRSCPDTVLERVSEPQP